MTSSLAPTRLAPRGAIADISTTTTAPVHVGRWRLTMIAISVAVVSLPLLRPSGPGNTGLVDLAVVGAMLASALWASSHSHVLRMPYALPIGMTVLAGALALATNGNRGGAITGILALGQDVFVLCWAAAVTTIGQDRRALDVLCRAWAYSATAWACVLIMAEIFGLNWLSGINGADGIRASLTLGDPNLAADYFLCGLMVMRATRRPRGVGWRWLACGLVITAMVLTLSNGGMLALLVATTLGMLFAVARRRGLLPALALGIVFALGGAVVVSTVDVRGWVNRVEESSPFVRDSIGRETESSGSRSLIVKESIKLWMHGDSVLGVGPGNTESTLRSRQAAYVKEAHDDYFAAVLERGVLGGIALVVLACAVVVRCRRISVDGGVSQEYLSVVPRPELLAAAVAAVALSAVFYEVLHFRHVWALLGLVAALELSGRKARGRTSPDRTSPGLSFSGPTA
jgi:O-antigen ligase